MKKVVIAFCFLLNLVSISMSAQSQKDKKLKVVIIRHAEKPAVGDNLCQKGLNRANALPATPFAVAHNLTLNSSFKSEEAAKLADDIKQKNGIVLVVWDHDNIPDLARAFGIKEKLQWKDEDYDSIWIVEFTNTSAAPQLRIEKENLQPKGKCD